MELSRALTGAVRSIGPSPLSVEVVGLGVPVDEQMAVYRGRLKAAVARRPLCLHQGDSA